MLALLSILCLGHVVVRFSNNAAPISGFRGGLGHQDKGIGSSTFQP